MAEELPGEETLSEEKKRFSIFRLLLFVIVLIVLGAGGYFGWQKFYVSKQDSAPKEMRIIYEFEPFLVNLADPGGKRYLKANIKVVLGSQKSADEFNERGYELRDLVLMLLSSKEYDSISTLAGKMAMKEEIISRLNQVLEFGTVKDIYFVELLVQ